MTQSNGFARVFVFVLTLAAAACGVPGEVEMRFAETGSSRGSAGGGGSGGGAPAGGEGGARDVDDPGAPAPAERPMCSTELASADKAWTLDKVLSRGPYLADHRRTTFTDPTRSTPANGIFPGKNRRELPTTIWYPAERGILGDLTPELNADLAAGGPFPLLLHSHGFMSNQDEVDYLAEHLASHGYVVVAPTFPLTHLITLGGPTVSDVVNQPQDVRFLLDTVIGMSRDMANPLHGAIDVERIALSGVSLGGATTYLATYHPAFRDARVKAVIAMAGLSAMLTPAFFAGGEAPILLLHGDLDAILDYDANAVRTLDRAGPLAHLLTMAGGTHAGFASPTTLLLGSDNVDKVGCAALGPNLPGNDEILSLVEQLGGAEAGLTDPAMPDPCARGRLPPAMAAKRQQDLTTAAVFPYLQIQFAERPETRALACRFLTETLPAEAPEMRYR